MLIRRKTLERLLADQQRAHQADRRELLNLIREQTDRIMFMAGRTWDTPPAEPAAGWNTAPDEPTFDPADLPDDLGYDPV